MVFNLELPSMLPLTAADYAAVPEPESVRLELSNGILEVAPRAQTPWHGTALHRICQIYTDQGRCAVGGIGVVLDDRTVRIPDVTRFRRDTTPDRLATQFPAAGVDLVVEIVSPESRNRDRVVKPLEYAQAHIPEFWLVEEDPENLNDAIVNIFQLTLHATGNEYVLVRRLSLDDLEKTAG